MSPGRRGSDRSNEPQALGAVLEALGAERRLAAGMLLGNLGRRWEAVVGERLAEETSPASLESGVLLIRASSAAWAAQIKFLAKDVRASANRLLMDGGGAAGSLRRVPEADPDEPIREVRVVVEAGPRTP